MTCKLIYVYLFMLILSFAGCQNNQDEECKENPFAITPDKFEVSSDACTLESSMSGIPIGVICIYIDKQAYDFDGKVITKVSDYYYLSDWFEISIALDFSSITINLAENTNEQERVLDIAFIPFGKFQNHMEVIQQGKAKAVK